MAFTRRAHDPTTERRVTPAALMYERLVLNRSHDKRQESYIKAAEDLIQKTQEWLLAVVDDPETKTPGLEGKIEHALKTITWEQLDSLWHGNKTHFGDDKSFWLQVGLRHARTAQQARAMISSYEKFDKAFRNYRTKEYKAIKDEPNWIENRYNEITSAIRGSFNKETPAEQTAVVAPVIEAPAAIAPPKPEAKVEPVAAKIEQVQEAAVEINADHQEKVREKWGALPAIKFLGRLALSVTIAALLGAPILTTLLVSFPLGVIVGAAVNRWGPENATGKFLLKVGVPVLLMLLFGTYVKGFVENAAENIAPEAMKNAASLWAPFGSILENIRHNIWDAVIPTHTDADYDALRKAIEDSRGTGTHPATESVSSAVSAPEVIPPPPDVGPADPSAVGPLHEVPRAEVVVPQDGPGIQTPGAEAVAAVPSTGVPEFDLLGNPTVEDLMREYNPQNMLESGMSPEKVEMWGKLHDLLIANRDALNIGDQPPAVRLGDFFGNSSPLS